jgi:hypothetical protein
MLGPMPRCRQRTSQSRLDSSLDIEDTVKFTWEFRMSEDVPGCPITCTMERGVSVPKRAAEADMSNTNASPTFEVLVPTPKLSKGEREYRTFLRLLPQLLATHRGRYVAIHEGQVVDNDADDIALIQRVHARIGYVPIHVGLVVESRPVERIPHYREYRPSGETA